MRSGEHRRSPLDARPCFLLAQLVRNREGDRLVGHFKLLVCLNPHPTEAEMMPANEKILPIWLTQGSMTHDQACGLIAYR